ncbi:hypothetical protein B0F90DRAFT_1733793 [Multifurca ochricompacta]|uniref:Uncharacterized protein n=1 Tax=Multifurca ochricompacta TaxID=376703 RepID=A0AAD4M168_9AGAM|nr:hypothetical protein B0F90DRAFT_1733793 [Multifurca ochricompacta]
MVYEQTILDVHSYGENITMWPYLHSEGWRLYWRQTNALPGLSRHGFRNYSRNLRRASEHPASQSIRWSRPTLAPAFGSQSSPPCKARSRVGTRAQDVQLPQMIPSLT